MGDAGEMIVKRTANFLESTLVSSNIAGDVVFPVPPVLIQSVIVEGPGAGLSTQLRRSFTNLIGPSKRNHRVIQWCVASRESALIGMEEETESGDI